MVFRSSPKYDLINAPISVFSRLPASWLNCASGRDAVDWRAYPRAPRSVRAA
jgi:hypothetical protein